AEKMDQDPPTIIQYGYADGDPVSPSVGKNTIIGAMVGMLLAIAMVVIGHLMNDTIMTAEDVERKLGMNLLGSLPEEETQEYDGKKRSSSKKKKPTKVKANPKRTA
ncbi:MAG: capsular biosynthesis protein, partial [Lachnospiraceae bacterium]|nr:capsular biosynthesis protein [Lachnospiraceae bacterium]